MIPSNFGSTRVLLLTFTISNILFVFNYISDIVISCCAQMLQSTITLIDPLSHTARRLRLDVSFTTGTNRQ